jgi:hypothetical protein
MHQNTSLKCKILKEKGKCRFNENCACLHKEEPNSQNKLNEMIGQCMIRHEQDKRYLKEAVKRLKEEIK